MMKTINTTRYCT